MINKGIMSSNTAEWATPQWLFDLLDSIYRFNLDPCSTNENAKCKNHYTEEEDGLKHSWECCNVFMNPPYGREIGKWVKKISINAKEDPCHRKVALLPARTDTQWFHDYIYASARIYFIRGRLKFNDGKGPAPFPSMIVVWNSSLANFQELVTRMDAVYKAQGKTGKK